MRCVIASILFFIAQSAFPQAPSKHQIRSQITQVVDKLNSNIVTLEKQISEAEKNNESEENIKPLREQLAMLKKQVVVIGGVSNGISDVSEKTIRPGNEEGNQSGIPKRDVARINSIPIKTLTNTELINYVQKVYTVIDKNISASQKKYAKELYDNVNAKGKSPGKTGNIAVLCWLAESTDMAIWIMGKACMDDPSNIDNLNNYASFLSMVGGEHLAVPILQNLLARFPRNTTLMNNLGQAWYGLGDKDNAKQYASGTLFIMAAHPYANEMVCGIAEAENKPDESIEALKKSIKEDYTTEKEAELTRKGYRVKFEDVDFKYPVKASPLGIEKFLNSVPDYPFEGGESAQLSRWEWDDYKQRLGDLTTTLDNEKKQVEVRLKKYANSLLDKNKMLKDQKMLKDFDNKIYKTANRKYALLIEWATDRLIDVDKKIREAGDSVKKWRGEYEQALLNVESCEARFALATNFNFKSNSLWQQRNSELLTFVKEFYNQRANLFLFAATDQSVYDLEILNIKLAVLNHLSNLHCESEVGCFPAKQTSKQRSKTLPDFDSLNCQYNTELSIPYLEKMFSIKVECNRMTTEFDLIYLKGSLDQNLANGKYHGEVEIRAEAGEDPETFGPLQMGAKIEVGAGLKFSDERIEDAYVFGEAGIGAGPNENLTHNLEHLPITPLPYIGSLEGRISIITGNVSVIGHGALSGITIK
jgi:hypothetical protein